MCDKAAWMMTPWHTRILEDDVRTPWACGLQVDKGSQVFDKAALGDEAMRCWQDRLLSAIEQERDGRWQHQVRILDNGTGYLQSHAHTRRAVRCTLATKLLDQAHGNEMRQMCIGCIRQTTCQHTANRLPYSASLRRQDFLHVVEGMDSMVCRAIVRQSMESISPLHHQQLRAMCCRALVMPPCMSFVFCSTPMKSTFMDCCMMACFDAPVTSASSFWKLPMLPHAP